MLLLKVMEFSTPECLLRFIQIRIQRKEALIVMSAVPILWRGKTCERQWKPNCMYGLIICSNAKSQYTHNFHPPDGKS